jgi:hypothetical protein
LIILRKRFGHARAAAVIRRVDMFCQLKKLNDESGVVLFMVLMVAIVIMIISVGVLTQSMNETNYAQQQIDQISTEQLAKGQFWRAYSTAFAAGSYNNMQMSTYSYTYNGSGRAYSTNVVYGGTGSSTSCPTCTSWTVTSNYDSL